MFQRVFENHALMAIGVFALAGLVLGILFAAFKPDKFGTALLRGVEAMLLAVAGGLLARTFVSVLLALAHDSPGARLAVGWGLFLWPGAIDTIPTANGSPLFSANAYLWMATLVGSFAGMMDGLWKIHDWGGAGWVTFPADVTWGLAGTTNACLVHLFNFLTTKHAYGPGEERATAHRYLGGFRFHSRFGVTLGSVMSHMKIKHASGAVVDYHPATPLFRHERTHVLQNRLFGPGFTLTYLGWMPLWILAGIMAGVQAAGRTAGEGIMWACYFNNPWEAWAYKKNDASRDKTHPFRMSDRTEFWFGFALVVVSGALLLLVVFKIWL